jgi:hypothetical protein
MNNVGKSWLAESLSSVNRALFSPKKNTYTNSPHLADANDYFSLEERISPVERNFGIVQNNLEVNHNNMFHVCM